MTRLFQWTNGSSKASASTLEASAALPNSGFAFVDNSQGASAAVAQLSDVLDAALSQIETSSKSLRRPPFGTLSNVCSR